MNAGTIECIVDEDGSFYFLEMNTRLQVEHTVTEMVTGYDLVALQTPGGDGREARPRSTPRGAHAIQCRINAEDPGRNFLPGPGRITRYEEPGGPVRSRGLGRDRPDATIPGDYDSMFAKLIVSGEDREQARRRMLRALSEFKVEGVPDHHPDPPSGSCDPRSSAPATHTTTWLERALADVDFPSHVGHAAAPSGAKRRATGRHPGRGRRAARAGADLRRAARHGAEVALVVEAHHGEHVHGEIRAPMQGTILKVLVEKGQEIRAGEVVCILEAMKMENHIASTRDGEVTELPMRAGQVVETGQVLAVID